MKIPFLPSPPSFTSVVVGAAATIFASQVITPFPTNAVTPPYTVSFYNTSSIGAWLAVSTLCHH
jgi:hypothetical protein